MTPIRRFGSHCLRRISVDSVPGAAETQQLLDEMWRVLAADGGVGLAAPQLGVNRRVVVIRDPSRPRGQQRVDLVNPVIVETFGEKEPFEEGCLSFPGLYTTVQRPRGVEFSYHDYQGQLHQLRDEKLLARIVLHEVDHLDGVLFIDRLSSWNRLWLGPRLLLIVLGRFWNKVRGK